MGDILQFPQRNKGRVRKSQSLETMGECALNRVQTRPANIEVLADHRECDADHGHLALMLAATIFATLPAQRKNRLANTLRGIAIGDQRARQLLRILNP